MSGKLIEIGMSGADLLPWADLREYELNKLKVVEGRNLAHLKNAMVNKEFKMPIAIWQDHRYVIDGAGRILALKELEAEGYQIPEMIPVYYIQASNFDEAREAVLMASSQHGDATQESVAAFAEGLNLDEIMDCINIPDVDLGPAKLTRIPIEGEEDDTPDLNEKEPPFTQPGDIYEIGPHRLMCGDSRSIHDFDKLMAGRKADLLLQDPPYNAKYEGGTEDKLTIKNDDMSPEDFRELLLDCFSNARMAMKDGAPFYTFYNDAMTREFWDTTVQAGLFIHQMLIWVKDRLVLGRKDYQTKHEPIIYGWAPGAGHPWYADGTGRAETTLLEFARPSKNPDHPTMKPVALIVYLVGNSSKQDDLVLDCFGGSGATMVAAHMEARRSCLMEQDPRYCDVIVKRMHKGFPGLQILLNGEPLEAMDHPLF
jgi:DNA modification methylase